MEVFQQGNFQQYVKGGNEAMRDCGMACVLTEADDLSSFCELSSPSHGKMERLVFPCLTEGCVSVVNASRLRESHQII